MKYFKDAQVRPLTGWKISRGHPCLLLYTLIFLCMLKHVYKLVTRDLWEGPKIEIHSRSKGCQESYIYIYVACSITQTNSTIGLRSCWPILGWGKRQ